MRNISFTIQAYADYLNWLANDKKLLMRITNLIKEAFINPDAETGNLERLKHDFCF